MKREAKPRPPGSFEVEVTDGVLDVEFVHRRERPMLAAMESSRNEARR
jgi:hypothetical protein